MRFLKNIVRVEEWTKNKDEYIYKTLFLTAETALGCLFFICFAGGREIKLTSVFMKETPPFEALFWNRAMEAYNKFPSFFFVRFH